jgi:LPXTG-motif cell wall-anchored protein
MIYLGYGFGQPRPGRWVVTLQTTSSTPASGADFAIAAQFNGGALLQITSNSTVPELNETVTITGTLTADGAAVPLTSASAILRRPDGSMETLEMTVDGNRAELKIAPTLSGIYGVEVNVLANSADGHVIDRAAFLTFEAQPTSTEIAGNQNFALMLAGGILVVVVAFLLLRRRRRAVT